MSEASDTKTNKETEVARRSDRKVYTPRTSKKAIGYTEPLSDTNITRDRDLTAREHLGGNAALQHANEKNTRSESTTQMESNVPTQEKDEHRNSQPNFLVPGARASHPQIHVSQPTIHHPHFTSPSIAQPMQAAQALFCHIQHQVQVEAVQQRMASAGALSSRALMVSRFANAPAYAAQMATRVSTASSGVMSQSAMQQAIHLQRLGNSNLVLDSFLANRTADMLLAHQIRLAAGLPLDPIGQSLLAHFGNQLSSTALLTDSASLSALGQCHAYAESSPTSAVLSSHPVVSSAGNRRFLLYMPSDNDMLAENQIAIRRNLELFEATQADVDTSVAGRRKPLVVGQVGIQCVHCSQVPIKHRKKGARYYPAKLDGIYQAAQNMAYCHLTQSCDHIDYIAKSKLLSFQKSRSNGHGGKTYWSQTARAQGVSETERLGLKFH